MKTYFGIDNGVTGSIGIIKGETKLMVKTPVKAVQDYTKAKKKITRVVADELIQILSQNPSSDRLALIERPMVNPTRFKATVSAVRCLEATLIVLESLEIPYMFVDSKEWQKELLPAGCSKDQLKKASLDIGCRLFPHMTQMIEKQKDADGLLIAEYARRKAW